MMIMSTMTRTNKKRTASSSVAAAHHSSTRCWPGCGSVTPFDGSGASAVSNRACRGRQWWAAGAGTSALP